MTSGDTERSSSGSDDKSATIESEAPSVSYSSTASFVSGDVDAKPKAGLIATYFLRSAMDWRGSRVETLEQKSIVEDKAQDAEKQTDNGDNNENLAIEVGNEGQEDGVFPVEVKAEPDAAVPADDTIPALEEAAEREIMEKPEAAAEKKEFEVTYECLPDVEEAAESAEDEPVTGSTGRRPMQFLDVLLQTDEHGIGVNVGIERVEDGEGSGGECVLVVQSFRRLNGTDVGPAEACGKIRVGDILHAVDGEEVGSLRQLYAKLAGRLSKRRKFVLLRFLRPLVVRGDSEVHASAYFDRRHRPIDANETKWPEIDALLHGNPQIAVLVRQLATTNEMLQEQLIAGRLKQEEQNIQLDQLHALYARTQAEGLPLFSLSKSIRPFSRKSSSTRVGDGLEKPIPTKIQTEVIEAINAEYDRLQQEFQLQHLLDKRELEKKYADKAEKLEEATAKKVEMLEAGFLQALQHFADGHHCPCHCQPTTAANVMVSTCDVLLNQCDHPAPSDEGTEHVNVVLHERVDASHMKLGQIMDLLAEYEKTKHVRTVKLETISSMTKLMSET